MADRKTIRMDGTEIQILHLGRAHTGGDLMVYLPDEKVLWMSESFHHSVFPSVGGGYPSEWVATLKRAEAMDVRIFAPAHGFVDSPEVLKEGVLAYRNALETLIAEDKRLKSRQRTLRSRRISVRTPPCIATPRTSGARSRGSAWSSTAGYRLPQEPQHADPEDSCLSFAQ